MFRCYCCREPIHGEREQIGARCPRCREPLYEPPHDYPRRPEQPGFVGGRCALHPGNTSLGTCRRCGNYLCAVCRTRWRDQPWCSACIDRALAGSEVPPEEARAHLRQAVLSIVFGVAAWLITLFVVLLLSLLVNDTETSAGSQAVAGLAIMLVLLNPCAMLGIGQGAAAIRSRGNHMILATVGLLLSGLQAGMLVAMFTALTWANL